MHAFSGPVRATESVTLASQWEPPHHIKPCSQWAVPRPIQLLSCDRREEKQPWSGKPKRELELIARLSRFDFFPQAQGKQQHGVMEAAKRQADLGKPVVLNFVKSVSPATISVSDGAIIHAKVSCVRESEMNGLSTVACSYFISPIDMFYEAPVITLVISPVICLAPDCMFILFQGQTFLSAWYKSEDI